MIARLTDGVSRRALTMLGALLLAFLIAPWFANDYVLTVVILILYFAYVGQAWNIMMGFAGQLSLGHALYVGLGAYTTAALYVHFGVSPWLGLPVAVAIAALAGAAIGYLAFRFGVAGVYFAILTIAFAEFARIGFDHFRWVSGSSGFFLPVANYTRNDLWNLRGSPTMFYYVILALTVLAFLICHCLLRSRIGYFWQAIREDELAAKTLGIDTFRCKMIAVVISAAMTSVAGVFFAFYYNNLFPRAGVQHLALDRADPGADHRRHRHAVRPDHRRHPHHRPRRRHLRIAERARLHAAGRAAGVLRLLPAVRGDAAAGRHLAAAGPQAGPRQA